MKVMFFPNGNTCAFENQIQVTGLQLSWFKHYIQYLIDMGKDPTEIEFMMPDGKNAKVFETNEGYNWIIEGVK